jgi:hypothetical protein
MGQGAVEFLSRYRGSICRISFSSESTIVTSKDQIEYILSAFPSWQTTCSISGVAVASRSVSGVSSIFLARTLSSSFSRVHLAGASLSVVVRDRKLDAANGRVAARHALTDGHTTAVLQACWIAGDLTGHDDPLHRKRVVISEG